MKVNGRKNKEKIVSICVVGALVCTLGIGVFSVISGTKDNKEIKNNVVDLNEQNSEDSNNNGLDNIVGFNVEDADEVSKDTESIFRGDVNEKDNVGMENNQQMVKRSQLQNLQPKIRKNQQRKRNLMLLMWAQMQRWTL